MSPFRLPPLYPVTDAQLAGLSHAEQVARLAEGGATLIQLREKHLSPREFCRAAERAVRVARARGLRLVVNDRADIALAVGAAGVHLGQDDLDPADARALLGPAAIVGYSTHTVEQAVAAARLPVTYIAIGPVFATSSKADPDPLVGLEGVRRVRAAVPDVPVVAIGGITRETARATLDAGADAVAVISALLRHGGDPARITLLTRDFISALSRSRRESL